LISAMLVVVLVPLVAWFGARKQIVSWALHRALASAGLTPATFQVRSVDLSVLRIDNLSIGSAPWLTVGDVEVTYSISDLTLARVKTVNVQDARWTMKVHDGSIDWGFKPKKATSPAGPINLKLPFNRLGLNRSTIELILDGATHEVPITAHITLTGASTLDGRVELMALDRPITLTARANSTADKLTIDLDGLVQYPSPSDPSAKSTDGPAPTDTATLSPQARLQATVVRAQADGSMQIALNATVDALLEQAGDTEIAAARGDFAARAELDGQSQLKMMTSSVSAQGLRVGDLTFADVQAGAGMQSTTAIDLTSFSAIMADGGVITIAPFTLDRRAPRARTQLSVSNVSMEEWLPVVTQSYATGQGRISGELEVAIDLTASSPRLEDLTGHLRADPQHGFIQVTDADAVGRLLESQDPRFATDEVMRPVRDKIVAALQDFAFKKLTVDLSRQADHTVAQAYLSGFGRHGQDPQGINLTLDLHVDDDLVDLASRMTALSKIRRAAQGALDAFFAPLPKDEKR
jgi:hypothetical protein